MEHGRGGTLRKGLVLCATTRRPGQRPYIGNMVNGAKRTVDYKRDAERRENARREARGRYVLKQIGDVAGTIAQLDEHRRRLLVMRDELVDEALADGRTWAHLARISSVSKQALMKRRFTAVTRPGMH